MLEDELCTHFAGFAGPVLSSFVHTDDEGGTQTSPLSSLDGIVSRDELLQEFGFEAATNTRYYVTSYNDVTVTLPTDIGDTDRIEIVGIGEGDGEITIDSQGIYIAYGSFSQELTTAVFPARGFHLSLRYNNADGGWTNSTDELVTRFGSTTGTVPTNSIVKTNNAGAVVTARMNLVAVATQTGPATYAANVWDLVPVNIGTDDVEIDLPPSVGLQNGDQIAIKIVGTTGFICNVNPDNTDTIDGVTGPAALTLSTSGEWVVLVYSGSGAWLQIS